MSKSELQLEIEAQLDAAYEAGYQAGIDEANKIVLDILRRRPPSPDLSMELRQLNTNIGEEFED